jgi:acyl-CoA reductase-like NAD-dependent aldehyde dehydrogenase
MNSHDHWIDAKAYASASGIRLERRSPGHGAVIASVAAGGETEVKMAVAAARRAFDEGQWRDMPGSARAEILGRLAGLIEANAEEFARLEAEESGKPIQSARAEVAYSLELTRFAISLAYGISGRLMTDSGPNKLGLVLQQPRGVAGLILPWNYPLVCLMQKLPFALAAGCAAVIKPSEFTPGTTLLVAKLASEAGVPAGQINVVIGTGPEVGEALTSHPDIDMISFTGSSRVGKHIATKCAANLKHCSLELGGKGANIVFADANLDAAVEGAYQGFTINAGQECCAGSRILVESSIAGEFVERLKARCAKANLGMPLDEKTDIGPLIHEQQLDRVMGYIASGKTEGARVATGGERAVTGDLGKGLFVSPTVFVDVKPSMRIFKEEIFGPVACVSTFDNFEEAISIANNTVYGLASGVWTSSLDKAIAVTRRIRSGMVYVNTYLETIAQLPFGGMRESGIGRENGTEGLQEFLETRAAFVRLNTAL